ncbi:MAG: LptA/OstA family protein [Nitrospinales bacterium]
MNKTGIAILTLLVFLTGVAPEYGYSDDLLSKRVASKDQPIEITSDRMRSDGSGQKIVFSGKVEGKWGDLTILSDVLEVYNPDGDRKTDRIVAIGHVIITRGLKKARGDKAVYLEKKQKITLTGNPKATAWEGKNVIEGKEMIFLLDTDRFVVNERVRMKIYPKKESSKK